MPPDEDVRRWARKVLGMSAGDDARFALLRQVKAFQFHPSGDIGAAFRIESEPTAGSATREDTTRYLESAGYAYDREQRRLQAIHVFAEEFFKVPPRERAARFETLAAECRGDRFLEGRLSRLRRGLDIDLDRSGLSADEAWVVDIVRELFPMPAEERAPRRRQLLESVRKNGSFDAKTLDRLAASWPELARLDPDLWRHLGIAVSTRRS